MNNKRLYRSKKDKMVSGVAGGLGEYYNTDPTLIRLAILFLAFVVNMSSVIILYFAMAIVVPENPLDNYDDDKNNVDEENNENI